MQPASTQQKNTKRTVLAGLMLLVLIVGGVITTYVLRNTTNNQTHAAGFTAIEAESGVINPTNAPQTISIQSDTTASGGQYVQFGSLQSMPSPSPTPTIQTLIPFEVCSTTSLPCPNGYLCTPDGFNNNISYCVRSTVYCNPSASTCPTTPVLQICQAHNCISGANNGSCTPQQPFVCTIPAQ